MRTPSYALGNVRMGFDHKPTQLSLFFEARNLANQNYVNNAPPEVVAEARALLEQLKRQLAHLDDASKLADEL